MHNVLPEQKDEGHKKLLQVGQWSPLPENTLFDEFLQRPAAGSVFRQEEDHVPGPHKAQEGDDVGVFQTTPKQGLIRGKFAQWNLQK